MSMNRLRLTAGILFASLAMHPCAPAMAQDALAQQPYVAPSVTKSQDVCLEECCGPTWGDPCPCVYVQVGALLMHQVPRFAGQPIVVDTNTNTTLLSTSDLDSFFNPGLQATVGVGLCGGRAVEFDYFGLFGGIESAVAVRPGANAFLTFPGNLAGNVFVDMDRVELDYSSQLHSFAANFLCCCGCCDQCPDCCGCSVARSQALSWFVGFRYLSLDEELNIAAQRTVGGAVEAGTYNVDTSNDLYGVQLGARLRRTRGRSGWEATGFGGIFANDAQQTQSVTDFPNFPLRPTVSSSETGVAFVGGGNVSALYLLTDIWNLKAGYNLIWIEGVALAPDQLDFDFAASDGGGRLNNGGGIFLHGVNIGLEARW